MRDPAFPAPHIRPARGWVNDPNGLCGVDGTQAGWAGSLTFPRELFVADGRLGSRPAGELTGLRRERAGADGLGSTFEVVAAGPAQPARVLVDGSMVEAFAGDGRVTTTRAYPTAASRWRVTSDGPVETWRLGFRNPVGVRLSSLDLVHGHGQCPRSKDAPVTTARPGRGW